VSVLIEFDGGAAVLDGADSFVIGRDPKADVTIEHHRVSRQHVRITREPEGWVIRDLNSSNGTFIDGQAITQAILNDTLHARIGGQHGPELRIRVLATESNADGGAESAELTDDHTTFIAVPSGDTTEVGPISTDQSAPSRVVLLARTRIGRAAGNDWIVFDPMMSRFHAEIVRSDDGKHTLVDLGSANGTFVDGVRIKRHTLQVGETMTVGSQSMRYSGTALEPLTLKGGHQLAVHDLSVRIANKWLLNEVTFDVNPRSLTAVIGPSGAGKSTLINAITGWRPATEGTVTFAGLDLYEHLDEMRYRIGYVPQADLLHSTLTARQALLFGSELRFPRDSDADERTKRVTEVLQQIGLTHRADERIDRLSGGERKRASVALELLTQPSLLILDEPTSGLDPGLDRQVMNLLRELADGGRTVFVVTHSVANLDVCDNLLVLATGGNQAYFGPPDAAFQFFNAQDWDEVFANLAIGNYPRSEQTADRSTTDDSTSASTLPSVRRQPLALQTWTLVRRYAAVIASDRAYLAFLVALPLFVGMVAFLSGSSFGLGSGDAFTGGLNPEARMLLLILVLGAVFVGSSASIQEIVKERSINQREQAIGLSQTAYLASKVIVMGIIVTVQTTVFTLISLLGRPGPELALALGNGLLDTIATISLLGVVSMTIGLVISARIRSTDVALPILVVFTMVAVVLSGAIPLRFPDMLSAIGWIDPAYWAMRALGVSTNLNELTGLSGDEVIAEWNGDSTDWWLNMGALAVFFIVGLVMLVLIQRRTQRRM